MRLIKKKQCIGGRVDCDEDNTHRDGEGDHKDTGEGADPSDDFAKGSIRHHVTIPSRTK